MADINELMIRLEKLESENSYLKILLEHAGIEYTPLDATSNSHDESFDPDQGSRILPEKITRHHAQIFYSYFWGRTDVYSKRSQNKPRERQPIIPNVITSGGMESAREYPALRLSARTARIVAGRSWKRLKL